MVARTVASSKSVLRRPFCCLAALVLLAGVPRPVAAQGGPSPEVREAVQALLATLESGDEASARSFVAERLTDDYRSSLGDGALSHIQAMRDEMRGAFGNVGLGRSPDGSMTLRTSGPSKRATLRLMLDAETGRFDLVELTDVGGGAGGGPGGGAPGRGDAVEDHLRALELLTPDDGSITDFRRRRMDPGLRSRPEVPQLLRTIARAVASAGAIGVDGDGPYEVLSLRGGLNAEVRMRVGETPPFLIEELTVDTTGAGPMARGGDGPVEPLAWGDLEGALTEALDWCLSGFVLAVRVVVIVLH